LEVDIASVVIAGVLVVDDKLAVSVVASALVSPVVEEGPVVEETLIVEDGERAVVEVEEERTVVEVEEERAVVEVEDGERAVVEVAVVVVVVVDNKIVPDPPARAVRGTTVVRAAAYVNWTSSEDIMATNLCRSPGQFDDLQPAQTFKLLAWTLYPRTPSGIVHAEVILEQQVSPHGIADKSTIPVFRWAT
jgi:hypothetical protein